ncbi:Detected protein of unknown function [Hibiscus syriacus]|uniref:DC1 domain-containing protein n=1 Tax=Hibiscus syriacus TaxID=106335 RepID=A0A6A3BLA4_HIBSY|nr:Detected protein of unknown function [Hibiscus syriacus]
MEIKLASHEHPMGYLWFHESDYKNCDKCREEIRGAAYPCVRCQVWLHELCAKALQHLPREITHPLHSHHHLVLDWSGHDEEFTCDLCLKVSSGTSYGCCRCDIEVDLACAFAGGGDHQTRQRSEDHEGIQHYCHRHQLILYKFSSAGETDYNCASIPSITSPLRLGFHHDLNLDVRMTLYCNACRNEVGDEKFKGTASYGCQECGVYLDIGCAKLLPTLKHECHHHSLAYFGPTLGGMCKIPDATPAMRFFLKQMRYNALFIPNIN